jgi:hypothetical protein
MQPVLAFDAVTASTLSLPTPGAVSAAIPLFLIGLLSWFRRLPRIAILLALLAGSAMHAGWLYTAIHTVLGGINTAVDSASSHALGGVVPGAVAIVMTIVVVRGLLRLDRGSVNRMLAGRPSRTGYYDDGYSGGRTRLALPAGISSRLPTMRMPEKAGTQLVALALPAVVATIPGNVGASVTSVLNVLGGLMAFALAHTIGVR